MPRFSSQAYNSDTCSKQFKSHKQEMSYQVQAYEDVTASQRLR